MDDEQIRREERVEASVQLEAALSILNEAKVVVISSIDATNGFPRSVPVVKSRNDGFKEVVFATERNSHKVANFLKNPNLASLSVYDDENSIVFYGRVEVYTELDDLKANWVKGMGEESFKDGPASPNLCIIKFIPERISGMINRKPIEKELI